MTHILRLYRVPTGESFHIFADSYNVNGDVVEVSFDGNVYPLKDMEIRSDTQLDVDRTSTMFNKDILIKIMETERK